MYIIVASILFKIDIYGGNMGKQVVSLKNLSQLM